QRDVGDGLELHHDVAGLAGLAEQGEAGGLAAGGSERGVAEARAATLGLDAKPNILTYLLNHDTNFGSALGGRAVPVISAAASARRKAPGFALLGEPGEARDIV
ncbi:hypothetical protein VM98_38295, partial [Streptomyces rubellomurinus subsp. indigoferus]